MHKHTFNRRGGPTTSGRSGGNRKPYQANSQGSNRPPPGLRGREIGMWYARRGSTRKKQLERQNINSVRMNRSQFTVANEAIQASRCMTENPQYNADEDSIQPERVLRADSDKTSPSWYTNKQNCDETNEDLRRLLEEKMTSKSYRNLLEFRQNLPAYKLRAEVMEIINSNQVVVISGETGCGKTTQIPQFILDDAISRGRGLSCKVVCTQPRRISAISVAERVAQERDENCGEGNSCGYQIRLQSKFPRRKASILYCTTGIIVQWLQSDPHLSQVSHVILDEIHERDLQSDFLIAIIKQIVAQRKDLKVVLMSATLNAEFFSAFFGGCPTYNIPGFTYPVSRFYLEDVLHMINYLPSEQAHRSYAQLHSNKFHWRDRRAGKDARIEKANKRYTHIQQLEEYREDLRGKFSDDIIERACCMDAYLQENIDFDLIVEIIKHIVRNYSKPQGGCGAILVFLTGWEDIKKLNDLLTKNRFFQPDRYSIIPLHSMMPSTNQKQVFDRPPPGVTKIVIATNIAETSITINDVEFVIDCGKIKIRNFEHANNINVLRPDWVTKANAKQRSGRAGRVQSGYSFHLFTKLQRSKMEDFMVPEILRIPLDEVCLQIKLLRLGNITNFLEQVMNPPSAEAVALSVKKLTSLNALDHEENLTALGYHLAQLPVEAQIGKMLLFGCIFSCLEPILTVAASLSFKDPFVFPLGKEAEADKVRKRLAGKENSDHVMLVNTFNKWREASKRGYGAERGFCYDHFLSSSTLNMLRDMRRQFAQYLHDAGFLQSTNPSLLTVNRHSEDTKVIRAIVCSGLYPNIAKICKKNPHRMPKLMTNTERRLSLHPKSVNSGKLSERFEYQWLCYYEKMRTNEVYLYDTSEVNPYSLLFFGGDVKTFKDEDGVDMISVDEWITFKAQPHIAQTVMKLRQELDKLLGIKIKQPHQQIEDAHSSLLNSIIDLISQH